MVPVPVNVGVKSMVLLSVLSSPVSELETKSGVCGVSGGVVSFTISVLVAG